MSPGTWIWLSGKLPGWSISRSLEPVKTPESVRPQRKLVRTTGQGDSFVKKQTSYNITAACKTMKGIAWAYLNVCETIVSITQREGE